jgi:hypothetical protein
MHRCRTSIFRQQRCVHVDHAVSWERQDIFGKELAVRGYDAEVRLQRTERFDKLRVPKARGLEDGQSASLCEGFDRRLRHALAPAPRAIGLCHNGDDRMRRAKELTQRRHGKVRRAEEDDSHHLPLFESFLILRTIRSF